VQCGSGSSILVQCGSKSGSRILMTKNCKMLHLKNKSYFFLSKDTIYLPLCLHDGSLSYKISLQPSKDNIQQRISYLFYIDCLILCPPCGSGSTTLFNTPHQPPQPLSKPYRKICLSYRYLPLEKEKTNHRTTCPQMTSISTGK
jgi:hypothetical protein